MRIAVFVDAGYLYAQGSIAITKAKKPKPREELSLDPIQFIARIKQLARELAPNAPLLRIYWYDAALPSGPHESQVEIALTDDIKLRLGRLHEDGQQKGVDSLIVTDLIELSRNKSIIDALLLSGDEDVRVGVEIAQSHGVRVHLLGIDPVRSSQSEHLRREADTRRVWAADVVKTFLGHESPSKPAIPRTPSRAAAKPQTAPVNVKPDPKPVVPARTQVARQSIDLARAQAFVEMAIKRMGVEQLARARDCASLGKAIPGPTVSLVYEVAAEQIGHKPLPADKRRLHNALRDVLSRRASS